MHKTDDLQYCCDYVSFPKVFQKVSETTFFKQSGIVGNLFVKLFQTVS